MTGPPCRRLDRSLLPGDICDNDRVIDRLPGIGQLLKARVRVGQHHGRDAAHPDGDEIGPSTFAAGVPFGWNLAESRSMSPGPEPLETQARPPDLQGCEGRVSGG